jgi:hypothetical protein
VNVTVGGTGGTATRVTSAGATAHLQLLALTLGGYTNLDVRVRHSADNTTFTDLMSFTPTTVAGAQTVSTASTVQRFTAISWDFVGAGSGQSAVPFVTLGRNN